MARVCCITVAGNCRAGRLIGVLMCCRSLIVMRRLVVMRRLGDWCRVVITGGVGSPASGDKTASRQHDKRQQQAHPEAQ